MSRHDNLLIELGTEELPPKALLSLSEAFAAGSTNNCARRVSNSPR